MEQYKKDFIEFMLDCGVLKFGDFVTKSGRNTPFFINTGFYRTGSQLEWLGRFYARAIFDAFGIDFDVLFGPAYKGIPLCVAAVMAFSRLYGREIRYASNRKEAKDHGDRGMLLGGPVGDGDRVIIIEDVTTAGTSVRETMPLLRACGDVKVIGMCVSVDREERGTGDESALSEISSEYGMKAVSIVKMSECLDYLSRNPAGGKYVIDDKVKAAIDSYYDKYGVRKEKE